MSGVALIPRPLRNRDFITRITVFFAFIFYFCFHENHCRQRIDQMHLAAHRRRAYPRGAHAGNQRRAALAGADTRGPCGTSALRRGRSRLFLRCRVRTYVSRRDGEDGPGVGGPFRCGACRSRIGPAGRGAGFVRPGRRRGLHPRHGFQFVLVPRRKSWKTYRRWATFSATRAAARR